MEDLLDHIEDIPTSPAHSHHGGRAVADLCEDYVVWDGPPGPVPFVTYNSREGLQVSPEVADRLTSQEAPLHVLTFFGEPKTGKSSFIRHAILRGKGLKVEDSGLSEVFHSRNDVVIWLWNGIIRCKRDDGSEYDTIVLESKNVEGVDESVVFALCVLLSSHVVYNGMDMLEPNNIQNLKVIKNLLKTIKATRDQEEEDGLTFREHFPHLSWLLRDIDEPLLDERRNQISSRTYLERCLRLRGFSEEAEAKNLIRKMIASFFPSQDCYTLPSPAEISGLSPHERYLKKVLSIRRNLIKVSPPKQIMKTHLDGLMFYQLAQAIMDDVNAGQPQNIPRAWDSVCSTYCKVALQKALGQYALSMTRMYSQLPTSDTDLHHWHTEQRSRVHHLFSEMVVGDQQQVEEYRERLDKELAKLHERMVMDNERASRIVARELLESLYADCDKKVRSGEVKSLEAYETEREKVRKEFERLTTGLSQYTCRLVMLEFLEQRLLRFTQMLIRNVSLSKADESKADLNALSALHGDSGSSSFLSEDGQWVKKEVLDMVKARAKHDLMKLENELLSVIFTMEDAAHRSQSGGTDYNLDILADLETSSLLADEASGEGDSLLAEMGIHLPVEVKRHQERVTLQAMQPQPEQSSVASEKHAVNGRGEEEACGDGTSNRSIHSSSGGDEMESAEGNAKQVRSERQEEKSDSSMEEREGDEERPRIVLSKPDRTSPSSDTSESKMLSFGDYVASEEACRNIEAEIIRRCQFDALPEGRTQRLGVPPVSDAASQREQVVAKRSLCNESSPSLKAHHPPETPSIQQVAEEGRVSESRAPSVAHAAAREDDKGGSGKEGGSGSHLRYGWSPEERGKKSPRSPSRAPLYLDGEELIVPDPALSLLFCQCLRTVSVRPPDLDDGSEDVSWDQFVQVCIDCGAVKK